MLDAGTLLILEVTVAYKREKSYQNSNLISNSKKFVNRVDLKEL